MVNYQLANIRTQVAELAARLRGILAARDETLTEFDAQRRRDEKLLKSTCERLKREFQEERQRLETQGGQDLERLAGEHKRNSARLEAAYARVLSRMEDEAQRQRSAHDEEVRKSKELVAKTCEEKIRLMAEQSAKNVARIQSLRGGAAALRERIEAFAATPKGAPEEEAAPGEPEPRSGGLERVLERAEAELAEAANAFDALRQRFWLRKMCPISPVRTYLLAVLLHLASGALIWHLALGWVCLVLIAASLVLACLLLHAMYRFVKARAGRATADVRARVKKLYALLAREERAAEARLERDRQKAMDEQYVLTRQIGRDAGEKESEDLRKVEEARQRLYGRYARVKEKLARKRAARLNELKVEYQARAKRLAEQCEAGLKQTERDHVAKRKALEDESDQKVESLATEWHQSLCGFRDFASAAMADCTQRYPAWGGPFWNDWKMPAAFPEAVPIGQMQVDMQKVAQGADEEGRFALPCERVLALPSVLSFPSQGSLLLRANPSARSEGLQVLLNVTLRLLTSFPPGKAKLILLDPVGLGQSFSALMHLADYDESLVGGQIWSEPTHIEKKLADLTEHIGKVIQKYLRGRYATIGEYNREAGVMAEAYHFLVIADFPTSLSELALERLASIVTSGVRCGVYTLILQDRRQKLPPPFEMAQFRENGLVVADGEKGLVMDDRAMLEPLFLGDPPPAVEAITALLHAIGTQCQEAKRIEMPFEMVVPQEGEHWSASAENGVRVPIGRTGADRSLYLDIGKGTAQHVLVSGKTGSGKSTLFHVLITNLALWFSPREVQFYLVDFKKGVEFKRFAAHRLPHARVIAIESDREFGLSVLERIDREFTYRADLYRKTGVQDLASSRQSGSTEHLPRILLIIDEFQEFFTEDDAIAQQAALLLDRIVRQGRAFGVHVILGSQTLGGAYALAKSTMGQMGVRIALQCSEADSYLILSDDNAAARLLSRPGEAIYNDMSGLVEGNNPFQVVWLPDDVQENYLHRVAERAEREGWQPTEQAVVFEGNMPADLRNNLPLRQLLTRGPEPSSDATDRVWLGDAITIKGPTEARFLPHGGSNLLIVGQRPDAALGMTASAVLSLAAHHGVGDVRIIVLDGSSADSDHHRCLLSLPEGIPHNVKVAEYRETPEIVAELNAEVRARQEDSAEARPRVYLIVFGLHRFHNLRQEDEFSLSDDGDKPSPGKCFANILTDGPEQGVHTLVWCDSLNRLNHTLNRKTLREFGMRVLFQMSPTDSAELTDTPLASKLGLYKALLFVEADGITESFRPYGPPEPDVLAGFKELLARRSA